MPNRSTFWPPAELLEVEAACRVVDKSVGKFQHDATLAEARKINSSNVPPKVFWGDFMGINPGPIPSDQAIAITVSLGLKWISISPERGWLTQQQQTDLVKKIHAAGLKVLVCLQEPTHNYSTLLSVPDRLAAFAAWAAGWVDCGVDAIQIGNEWNNDPFWMPKADPTMAGAAKIHITCINAIRLKSKTIPVYTVAWSPNGGDLSPETAQKALGWAGVNGEVAAKFTGAGHHPYVYNGPNFGMPDHKEWNAFAQTPDVYAAAKFLGLPGPMCLSEYGVPSAGTQDTYPNVTFTEVYQAQIMKEYFAGFEKLRVEHKVPIAYIGLSTAIDGDAATRPIESSMGMFRKDGTEKPAASVVRIQAKKLW